MSGSAFLQPRHIFGVKGDVTDSVQYLEENVVLFPAGHNSVIYHTETKTQKFIPGSDGTKGISALAVSPSRRYVAIAEEGQWGVVSIFDWHTQKKRKVLSSAECGSSEYVSMCFSSNKLLLTLGGGPDWTLVLWQWEKAKVLSTIKVTNASGNPLSQCSFNPVDPSVVCVTGEGIFKAFRIADNVFKPMPNLLGQMQPLNFTSHMWLNDDRVVLGTDQGKLVLFEAGEYLATLECSPNNGLAVNCMAALSDGFIVGCEGGDVRVYSTVNDEAGYYSEIKSVSALTADMSNGNPFQVAAVPPAAGGAAPGAPTGGTTKSGAQQDRHRRKSTSGGIGGAATAANEADGEEGESVLSIAVAPSEEHAICTLSSNQIVLLRLASSDLLKQGEISTSLLSDSFHRPGRDGSSRITGMDVCIRKPLVATCGVDCSVRVWNFVDNRCEASKVFTEVPHSVAFHPSGLHLLVGFTDKLRLMNLLMDDLRDAKELSIKACRECQFSNGGHQFAAVNGNAIQIFNTYTCECIRTLRGHNGKVRSLFWSANDTQLVSAGVDGAIYQWDIKENKRDGEYVKKGCSIASALCNKAGDAVFAVGNDNMLREVEFPVSVVTKEITCGAELSQLAMSSTQRMLFGATAEPDQPAYVRSFKFPLTGDFSEQPSLAGPVTRVRLSWEDQFLFVAGECGCLQVFDVREKDLALNLAGGAEGAEGVAAGEGGADGGGEAGGFANAAAVQLLRYSEEILVTKSDLEERNALVSELKNKVDELTLHNEYQLRLKDMNYNEKIKEVTEKFTQELEQDKNRYELLREEKNDLEMEYADRIKQVEDRHQQRLQEVESTYQNKIMAEVERYQQLCHERDQQKSQWDQQQRVLVESHEQYIGEITSDYEHQLSDDTELKEQLVSEVDELRREFEETMRQLEGDIDKEIELLKSKYEGKLTAEREATLRFKGENGIMKKKFSALQKDIEVQREDIKAILAKEQELVAQIRLLEREIQNLRAEIRDRDETIGDKEKRIYDLKKKNQELEKFKFVLDYKIKELKRQIEPRENEIADMKDQIKDMDHELEQYHKSNADLDVMIGELRTKLDSMQRTIMANRQRLVEQKTKMTRFVSSLDEASNFVQNPVRLRDHIKGLYEQFVNEQVKAETIDVDIKREYHRQKDYLEKSALALKRRLDTDVQKHKEENMLIMERNMRLIGEINDLREEIRVAKLNSLIKGSDVTNTKPPRRAAAPGTSGQPSNKARRKLITSPEDASTLPEDVHLIEEQRAEIGRLKNRLASLEDQMTQARPVSRERLKPLR